MRIEARGDERGGPVVAQVDGDRTVGGPWRDSVTLQGQRLVAEHLGLVDLEDHGVRRPVQPERAGVQTRRQDDHLRDARLRRRREVLVEEVGPHRLVVDGGLEFPSADIVVVLPVQVPVRHPRPLRAGRRDQQMRELVADQGIGAACLDRAAGRDAQRRAPDAFGDVPAVSVGPHGPHLIHISHL